MNTRIKKPMERIGYDFVPEAYRQAGQDEYYIRDQQFGKANEFRRLSASEIESLVKNENVADNWEDILVSEAFDPGLVRNCHFHGRVRIGALEPFYLEYHELRVPVGLYNSTIISSDIGDHVAIRNVHYLAYYIIGDDTILFNINEMQTTNHAKFGNGMLKDGEEEHQRIWLEIGNENGGRSVLPFADMLPADACLWSWMRDDADLLRAFREMTDRSFDRRRGFYGTIGRQCVIKNSLSIKDVQIGSHAYIKGANKLKNLTIKSSASAPSQIGEGVELVNGIMGYGSRAFYGVKAVRFVLGENSTLKYGARLINSILGDNSTISCCEVLNSLIFPGHEQHHNNSFLIAARVLGQSNIAAGATIGSNHNSRGADGEVIAGRGFWPGLCVSLKHNSRFASFSLLASGQFPAELNVTLPFALVANNVQQDCLDIIPAFWWLYNMYALTRNARKYEARDKRSYKLQSYETNYLAPDTAEEIFGALRTLETAVGEAWKREQPGGVEPDLKDAALGKYLLTGKPEAVRSLSVQVKGIENSTRPARLLKVVEAYTAYRRMLHFYGVKTLVDFLEIRPDMNWSGLMAQWGDKGRESWFNLGGQLVTEQDLDHMLAGIRNDRFDSWDELHQHYRKLDEQYPEKKVGHAISTLLDLFNKKAHEINSQVWIDWLIEARAIATEIGDRTYASRAKDHEHPFRQLTYRSRAEMEAVQGALADNPFIHQMRQEAEDFGAKVDDLVCNDR